MKGIKFFVFACVMMFSVSIFGQTARISKYEMPGYVTEFVQKFYSNYEGGRYYLEYSDKYSKLEEYEVVFRNDTKLEFDTKGNLKSIDCGRGDSINPKILPIEIAGYIDIKYPNVKIIEYSVDDIGKRREEHEVELSNGLTLTFNKRFKLVEREY